MYHHMYFNNGSFLDAFGGVLHMIIPVIILIFIFSFFNRRQNNDNCNNKSETALEILKKRYANSEITKEEYKNIKEELIK